MESIEVRNGNTKKAYYPIVVPSETSGLNIETQETNETKVFPQFFTFHKINVPKNFALWSKDWLIYQILGLWKCGIELDNARYSIDNYNEAIQFLVVKCGNPDCQKSHDPYFYAYWKQDKKGT